MGSLFACGVCNVLFGGVVNKKYNIEAPWAIVPVLTYDGAASVLSRLSRYIQTFQGILMMMLVRGVRISEHDTGGGQQGLLGAHTAH